MSWGYAERNGPTTWGKIAEAANGQRQSPIDIVAASAKYDSSLEDKPLRITYDPSKVIKFFNTGSSVQMLYNSEGSSLTGGPLSDEYQVLQFHFHWGKTSDRGSEHTVDGKMYAAEAHIVHWNSVKYPDVATAVKAGDGLCVLGMFLQPGAEHAGIQKVIDMLPNTVHSGETVQEVGEFDPSCMLPEDRTSYWTYLGSLTTPPCYESVTWVMFKQPIEVSEDQLKALRNLKTYAHDDNVPDDELHGCMYDNFRPPLPLNDRTLRASFH